MRPEDINFSIYREMAQYCEDNNITSYAGLISYACDHRPDWFTALCRPSACRFMTDYIRQRKFNKK